MDDDAAADGARVDDTAAQLVVFTTTPTSTVRLALRAGACGGGGLCSLLPSNTSTDMSVQLKIKAMSYTSMYRSMLLLLLYRYNGFFVTAGDEILLNCFAVLKLPLPSANSNPHKQRGGCVNYEG